MPVFTVTRPGDWWPRMGGIKTYQTDRRTMVTKRRLKLDTAQQAIFNVCKRVIVLAGEVERLVKPSWADLPVHYHAKITCRS